MHNRYPQLGYFDKGLGVFIYNDQQPAGAQLGGDPLSDLWASITGGVGTAISKTGQNLQTQFDLIPGQAKNAVISSFLDTSTGQAVVADAQKTWLQQQQDKVKTIYLQNKTTINTGIMIAGAVALFYMLYIARASGRRAASSSVAAANPRRKKRRKSSRRKATRRRRR